MFAKFSSQTHTHTQALMNFAEIKYTSLEIVTQAINLSKHTQTHIRIVFIAISYVLLKYAPYKFPFFVQLSLAALKIILLQADILFRDI